MKCCEYKHFRKYFEYYPIYPAGWCDMSGEQKVCHSDYDQLNQTQ